MKNNYKLIKAVILVSCFACAGVSAALYDYVPSGGQVFSDYVPSGGQVFSVVRIPVNPTSKFIRSVQIMTTAGNSMGIDPAALIWSKASQAFKDPSGRYIKLVNDSDLLDGDGLQELLRQPETVSITGVLCPDEISIDIWQHDQCLGNDISSLDITYFADVELALEVIQKSGLALNLHGKPILFKDMNWGFHNYSGKSGYLSAKHSDLEDIGVKRIIFDKTGLYAETVNKQEVDTDGQEDSTKLLSFYTIPIDGCPKLIDILAGLTKFPKIEQ